MLDGVDAHDNRIMGNWIGFTKTRRQASTERQLRGGPQHGRQRATSWARPTSPTATSSATTPMPSSTTARAPTATSSRTTCCASRPAAARPPAPPASTTTSGPRTGLIGGDGDHEHNVIGPTTLQGIEFSHGWDKTLPWGTDTATTYQINDNSAIGNWVGFRMDGSYEPKLPLRPQLLVRATTVRASTSTTAPTATTSCATTSRRPMTASRSMAPNATGNVVRGNIIGVAPNGDAGTPDRLGHQAPLGGRERDHRRQHHPQRGARRHRAGPEHGLQRAHQPQHRDRHERPRDLPRAQRRQHHRVVRTRCSRRPSSPPRPPTG